MPSITGKNQESTKSLAGINLDDDSDEDNGPFGKPVFMEHMASSMIKRRSSRLQDKGMSRKPSLGIGFKQS